MSETSLIDRIRAIMRSEPLRLHSLAGGMISQVMRVDFADGSAAVVKTGEDSHDLRIEAYMLDVLRERTELPVPQALHAESDLLLMEHIAGSHELNVNSLRHLGRLLAACHQVRGLSFGLERDTLIGPLHQPNSPMASWIDFFREHRLLYMTGLASQAGELPRALEARIWRLAEALERYLVEPEYPALIHGDIWRTNILASGDKIVGIIDPALYYAHNEMELAYMRLFAGFGNELFSAYQETLPIDAEFYQTREHVYSLYPLLVHLRIFGAKYLQPLDERLNRLGI